MITRKRIALSEKQAALIWQEVVGRELTCTEEGPVRVIYPGRANGDKGPDFRDAVIRRESRVSKGDVEVHVRSSDWYSHEHHSNPEYNNVILHVVMWHDCRSVTALQSGRSIPVLCLAQALGHQAYLLPYRLPCFQILGHVDRQRLAKSLSSAGEERFKHRAAYYRERIRRLTLKEDAEQVLLRGMMRALGFASNTKPFEDLADRMPRNSIESGNGLALRQALLLGTAGLLPSQRWPDEPAAEQEAQELEQIWRSAGKNLRSMKEDDWNLLHVYPNNSPVRRVLALAHLLERYYKEGLLAAILHLVTETPLPKGHDLLEHGLTVASDGYWQDHFDFRATSRTKISALLGNSKAGELMVNVALPFSFSWGQLTHEAKLAEKAISLYRSYPRLTENCITRHMTKQLCLEGLSGLTACHQQGLIHIFRNYCREGKCSLCPLVD